MIAWPSSSDSLLRAADILDPQGGSLGDAEWWKPNPDPTVTDKERWLVDKRTGAYVLDEETGLPLIQGRARRKQRPPADDDWFIWLVLAGRGFGKTRTGIEWLDRDARLAQSGQQFLLAGRTPADVRDYTLYGPGGLLTHHPDVSYEASKRMLTWPNGVQALIRSGANPEEFRGFSGARSLLEEFAAWQYAKEAWENLSFGMREGDPRIGITTTPRDKDVLRAIIKMPGTRVVGGSSLENSANLADKYRTNVLDPLLGTRLGRREILAEMLADIEGALWTQGLIDDLRVDRRDVPQLKRVVVGVDPQGKKKGTTDSEGRADAETGIVVAGLGVDEHVYVLEDGSLDGKPSEWGLRTVALYDRHKADRVAGERNFGGDMVEHVVRTVRKNISYEDANASRGKQRRAEPVAALYEQGRVHHVIRDREVGNEFAALESEMTSWTPESDRSPNRMDALVWAVSILVPQGEVKRTRQAGVW